MVSLLTLLLLAQAPATDFCPQGWEPLPEDACLLRGDRPGLIVYFHGMTAPANRAIAWELSFVTRVPKHRRASLVVLRGVAGLCDWADEYRGWWCWPTAKTRLLELQTVVERIDSVVASASSRLKSRANAPVIAGYSNGAYLVTMLMAETKLPASGWVVMHGGPVSGTNFGKDRERPTLLLAAADDGVQRPAMETLKSRLDVSGWASMLVVRPGSHPPEVEDYERLFDFASSVSR
jgi:predicted esterase